MPKLLIPESWSESPIGEVLNVVGGATPDSSEKSYFTDSGKGIPWITPADLGRQKSKYISNGAKDITESGFKSCSTRMLPAGSIIFSSRAPIGHVAIASNDLCTNQGFKSIEKNSNFDSDFIYYYLRHIKSYVESLGSGTTFKEVSGSVMKTVPIVIPPLDEQKRISKKIESTQEKIKTIEESVSKAEELIGKYRESLLQKAFRGQLVPQDPNDEPASELLKRIRAERAQATDSKKKKKEDLPPISGDEIPFEIPKSWAWVRIGELFQIEMLLEHKDGNHGSNYPRSSEFVTSGIPFLTAKSINSDEQISEDLLEYLSKKKAKSLSIGHIKKGDVLFAHNATVGPVVEYNFDFDDAVIGTSLTCFRPNPKYLNQKFLTYVLRSWVFQSQIRKVMGQATRNQVPITKQREMILPLPPLNEQNRIANSIDKLIPGVTVAANRIDEIACAIGVLRQSILNSAFSGKLVSQHSAEGTGHELMKKISLLTAKADANPIEITSRKHKKAKKKVNK